jgi:hypothetical protein
VLTVRDDFSEQGTRDEGDRKSGMDFVCLLPCSVKKRIRSCLRFRSDDGGLVGLIRKLSQNFKT